MESPFKGKNKAWAMSTIEEMAREAGFLSEADILGRTTNSMSEPTSDAMVMEFVPSNIMPDGWFGLRTDKGVMCVGLKGSFWVPAFDVQEMMEGRLRCNQTEAIRDRPTSDDRRTVGRCVPHFDGKALI